MAQQIQLAASPLEEVRELVDLMNRATEEATETILDAAEAIMGISGATPSPDQETIATLCMRIIEACHFQDLTGQRANRVQSILTQLESVLVGTAPLTVHESNELREAEAAAGLLDGPQNEKPSQDDIDALFDSLK